MNKLDFTNLCLEIHLNEEWVISYVHCEHRPTNATEEFLLVNFPGLPINKCRFRQPSGSSEKEVVDEFNKVWRGKFDIYAIGAKLVPNITTYFETPVLRVQHDIPIPPRLCVI